MKSASLSTLGLVAILSLSLPNASAQTPLATGRAALAQQTPAALENAHAAFKTGLQTAPNDPELNFFYAATLLAREAHTEVFQQQFTSLNATIISPSLYELEYSFPLGFANLFMPAVGATTDAHLAYLNSKATLIEEALSCLDKITNDNFVLTLTSAETSLLDTKVDYGDVCLLRAGLRLARAGLYLANSYNISGEYRKFYDLYAAGNLTPQAVLATFPQLFNLSTTTSQRVDARTQIQLAHAEWNKALAAIKTKRPVSEGTVLGPNAENDSTPFLFAFENIDDAEVVDAQFDALVLSLSSQQILPANASDDFYLEGYKINLSPLVTSSASLRSLAPTRFDRGFFRPSSWPDATLGGIFPDATQDDMNDAGNFLFVLQPTVYEPYQFWLLAGNPEEPGYFEEGEVRFNQISGIAVDSKGNIYVADSGNHVIRKISTDNKVTTIAGQKWSNWQERRELERKYAGNPQRYPGILFVDGPIAVDGNGTVYFENGNSISKISENGILSHFAGSFSWDSPRDGFGSEAAFAGISAMTVDKNGNLLVCDGGAIRKITPAGHVTTIAGILGWEEGYVEGNGSLARFSDLTGIAVDEAGVIYVMDSNNYVIRKIQPNGFTSTFVGNAKISNHFDAKGTKARLNRPEGLAIDSSGNLFFADASTIRKVKPDGTITSIAGKVGKAGSRATISGQMGILERAGEAAVFGEDDEVTGLAVDRRGTLYASFEDCIYEAESVFSPPSGEPFPVPNAFPEVNEKPDVQNPDSNPPQLVSLTLEKTSIDLTNGSVDLPFTLSFSEKIDNASVYFGSFGGHAEFGPQLNQLKGLIEIPGFTKTGIYNLGYLNYSWGDYPNSQSFNFDEDSIPEAFKNIAITVTNPFSDTEAPVVYSVSLFSTEVNASSSSAKIRYRVQISDNSSEFKYLKLIFESTSAPGFINSVELYEWDSLVAVNGVIKTYEGSIQVNQGSPLGDWMLKSVEVSDNAGNYETISLTSSLQDVKYTVSSLAVALDQDLVFVSGGILPESSQMVSQKVNSFQIKNIETTWAEWKEVREWGLANGYNDLWVGDGSGDDHPVRNISWYDAVKWCNAKSEREGLIPVYIYGSHVYKTGQVIPTVNSNANGYRLPTEAEWEWAARGGIQSKGYLFSGGDNIDEVSWHMGNSGNATVDLVGLSGNGRGTWPVANKLPNELGIYDMSGNVHEWCWDEVDSYHRRLRGGGFWVLGYNGVRDRYFDGIDDRNVAIGFRVARNSLDQFTPWPIALTLDKSFVDVSEADQKVKFQLEINNDDLPSSKPFVTIDLTEDVDVHGKVISFSDFFEIVQGTVANGIYEAIITIPRYYKNGNYTVSRISIDDFNTMEDSPDYHRWGDSVPLEFRKSLTVTGTQDKTAPLLQNIFISPSRVDTRNGTVLVTANLTITDDLIGLENKKNWHRVCSFNLVSPSGKEFVRSEFNYGNRIGGTSTNGTYQVQFELPQYSEEGAWSIDYIELYDMNYNTRFLIPANLTAQQIAASTIQVQGWPRGWETVSLDDRDAATNAKAIVTKQSAKFWLPVENIDRNWTWGAGSDNSLEYEWTVEFYGNSDYAFSFTKWKSGDEGSTSGNFTQFLDAGQVNVWEEHDDSGSVVAGASITASRDGQRLLLELTDPMILSEIQAEMPSYLSIRSLDPQGNSYNKKVKVEYVKENVQLVLGNLTHTFDGTEKKASFTISPGNLTQNVTLTYDGVTAAPTAPGNYTVVAFMDHPSYQGRQVGTMTIAKQSQTIGAFSAIGDKVYGATPFAVTVPTASSGLPVTLSVKSGPATISANNTVTLTGSGEVVLAANQSGNETCNSATEVITSFNVSSPPPQTSSGGGGGGGGAPSVGGGGVEPEKSKKGKKGSDKKDDGGKKSSNKKSDKKDNDQKDSSNKASEKKSPGKKSSGGDSQKSSGSKKKFKN